MPSVETMIKRVHAYREQIENDIIAGDARALMFLFSRAERRLTTIQKRFSAFAVSEGGLLQKTPENIAQAQRIADEMVAEIDEHIVRPGKEWAKGAIPRAHTAGRKLANVNLDVDFVSPELIGSTFRNVSVGEKAILEVGFNSTYRIMNVVGDDVGQWFRRELTDAVIDGIPVQGAGS